jgi:hypothetical protein
LAFNRALKRSGRATIESASGMEVEFVSGLWLPLNKLSELAGEMDCTAAGGSGQSISSSIVEGPKTVTAR